MGIAFSIDEIMKGTHHFVDPQLGSTEESEFYFKITWGQSIVDFFNPLSTKCFKTDAEGTIFVTGLTSQEVPTKGTLELNYFSEQKLRYTLNFSVKGEPYQYVGEKVDVKLWRPLCLVKTHTTCYGKITDKKNKIISKSVTHFEIEPGNLLYFASSFKISLH